MTRNRSVSPRLKAILWVLGVIIVACVGFASYGLIRGDTAPSGHTSGIEGTVSYGPLCPTEPCSAKPAYDFDIIALKDGSEVARTRPVGDGKYTLKLPPGRYEIKVSRSFASELGGPPRMVQVEANKPAHLDLTFDTGIR